MSGIPETPAIIIGSEGQDGRLLREHFESLGRQVFGISRNGDVTASASTIDCDVLDKDSIGDLLRDIGRCEIYYLAARHHSSDETDDSIRRMADAYCEAYDVHVSGLLNIVRAMERASEDDRPRVFYASSAQVFGESVHPLTEDDCLNPYGVYALTKAVGSQIAREARERGLFVSTGFLFNHESGLRPERFLTRRVVETALRIAKGSDEVCEVGALSHGVDWGLASDYVRVFAKILALPRPDSFVVATGQIHTVEDFVAHAFAYFGLRWRDHVVEVPARLQRTFMPRSADPSKLESTLGFSLQRPFEDFVRLLIDDILERNHSGGSGA